MYRLIIAVLVLHSFMALGQKKNSTDGYVINGHITGAANTKIFLQENSLYKSQQAFDSTIADKDGRFVFRGTLTEPSYYQLMVKDKNGAAWFILENSKITMKGNADSLQSLEITGSWEQDVSKLSAPLFQDTSLNNRGERVRIKMESALKSNDTILMAEAKKEEIAIMDAYADKAIVFMSKYPNTTTSTSLINFIIHANRLNLADSLLTNTEKNGFAHYSQVKALRKIINANTKLQPGKPAINFTQADTSGNMISLESFKGKYVLLDFWASWCKPCREENPVVVEAYNLYKNKNFTVLSVSLDGDKNAWLQAIEKDQLKWTHVSDLKGWKNEVATMYGITGVPTNYILDPSGVIIAKNLRGAALKSFLKKELEKQIN